MNKVLSKTLLAALAASVFSTAALASAPDVAPDAPPPHHQFEKGEGPGDGKGHPRHKRDDAKREAFHQIHKERKQIFDKYVAKLSAEDQTALKAELKALDDKAKAQFGEFKHRKGEKPQD